MSIVLDGTTGITAPAIDAALDATDLTGRVPDANAPLGSVIQVVSATKTDTFSRQSSSSDFGDITGLSVSITPTSATSKILILANIVTSSGVGERHSVRLVRNSTAIAIGDSAGSRVPSSTSGFVVSGASQSYMNSLSFLDSPNTESSTTYKLQGSAEGSGTFYCNRSPGDSNDNSVYRPVSTITVMEIAA